MSGIMSLAELVYSGLNLYDYVIHTYIYQRIDQKLCSETDYVLTELFGSTPSSPSPTHLLCHAYQTDTTSHAMLSLPPHASLEIERDLYHPKITRALSLSLK